CLIDRGTNSACEILRASNPPVVQKHDSRLLPRHVLVDGHDLDISVSQCSQDWLQLAFGHREVPIYHGLVIRTGKCSPRVDTHRVSDRVTMHMRGTSDRYLVDAVREVSLVAEDAPNLIDVELRVRGIDVGRRQWRSGLLDAGEHLPHRTCQSLETAIPGHVHEHHARALPEKVVVQCGDLESILE